MSELFAVRVVGVSPESARLEVRSVHPDSGPPMPTATFALMLMYDPIINSGYSAFRKYRHLEASPLAQAMDRDGYLDAKWVPANARAFVAKVKVSRGVLEVWPTHPGWIEHLRVGMAWDTAAYSNGPGAQVKPRAPAVGEALERSNDPMAGFRVGVHKLDHLPKAKVLIVMYGANRYLADPVIKAPAAMVEAAPGLMGQPVLVVPKRGPSEIGTVVEVRDEGIYLYTESEYGWGGSFSRFEEMRSMGRAWLKVPATQGAATKMASGKKAGTKKAAAKKAAVKKVVAKVAAKKVGAKAAAKVAAKKTSAKAKAKANKTNMGKKAAKAAIR